MKKAEVLKAIAQKRKRYPRGHPKGGQFAPEQDNAPAPTRLTPVVAKPSNGDTKDWKKRLGAFDDSPAKLRERVSQFGHPDIVEPIPGKRSFFRAMDGICLAPRFNKEVYQHEYGHFLDHEFSGSVLEAWSNTGDFDNAFQEETLYSPSNGNFMAWKAGWQKSKHHERYQQARGAILDSFRGDGITELGAKVLATQRLDQFEDIVSAMSTGFFAKGHSPEYFSRDNGSLRNREIFANFFAFYSDPNPALRELPKQIAPKMWSVFVKKMQEEGFGD